MEVGTGDDEYLEEGLAVEGPRDQIIGRSGRVVDQTSLIGETLMRMWVKDRAHDRKA